MNNVSGPWQKLAFFSLDGIPVIEQLKQDWTKIRDEYYEQRGNPYPYPLDIYSGRWLVTALRSNEVEQAYLSTEHRKRVIKEIRGEPADGLSLEELNAEFNALCESETAFNRAAHPTLTDILDPLYPQSCRMYNYSLMQPGVRLSPHMGFDAQSVRVHLCLQEDPQCWINVMGETRTWRDGEVFAFDDANIHLAEHHGTRERLVVIADFTKAYIASELKNRTTRRRRSAARSG